MRRVADLFIGPETAFQAIEHMTCEVANGSWLEEPRRWRGITGVGGSNEYQSKTKNGRRYPVPPHDWWLWQWFIDADVPLSDRDSLD